MGMDARRATGRFRRRPAAKLQASTSTSRNPTECAQFMQSMNWDRSRHAWIRRSSRKPVRNAGQAAWLSSVSIYRSIDPGSEAVEPFPSLGHHMRDSGGMTR